MAKRVKIKGAFEYQYYVIGIASDERIWKLCFEINNSLTINLLQSDREEKKETEETVTNTENPLFGEEDLTQHNRGPAYYEDTQTDPSREYVLTTADRSNLPKSAKAFPYFFGFHIFSQ